MAGPVGFGRTKLRTTKILSNKPEVYGDADISSAYTEIGLGPWVHFTWVFFIEGKVVTDTNIFICRMAFELVFRGLVQQFDQFPFDADVPDYHATSHSTIFMRRRRRLWPPIRLPRRMGNDF